MDVSDRAVVLAGSYDDEPGQPWRIVPYVDDRCAPAQHEALTALYLQRLPFSSAIAEVCGIRPAAITLDHTPNAQRIDVDRYVTVRTREPFHHTETVTCAIPGHDHPSQEIVADVMRIDDPALAWEVAWPMRVRHGLLLRRLNGRGGSRGRRRWPRPRRKGAWLERWRPRPIDGTTLDLADPVDNERYFGRPGSGREERSAWPQLRMVETRPQQAHRPSTARPS